MSALENIPEEELTKIQHTAVEIMLRVRKMKRLAKKTDNVNLMMEANQIQSDVEKQLCEALIYRAKQAFFQQKNPS
jgi:hypothetical protein